MNSSRIVATLQRITANPRWLAFMARQTPERQAMIRHSNAFLLRCAQSNGRAERNAIASLLIDGFYHTPLHHAA